MLRKCCRLFSTLKPVSPYKVLNLQQTATQEQIKSRYYELAQKFHPDHDPSFAQKFKSINEAYQTLKDPQKRRQLDHDIQTKGAPTSGRADYSSTRYSYGNAYAKQQAELQKQYLRRQAHYAGKGGYTASNDRYGFGFDLKQEQGQGMKHARIKQQHQTIKFVLSVGLAVVALFGVVQLVFKVYQFNTQSHKKDSEVLRQSNRSRHG